MNAEERKVMTFKLPVIRPLLYTDTIGGNQVCRDDMWALTTEELNGIDAELTRLREAVDAACDRIAVRDREKANELCRRAAKEG